MENIFEKYPDIEQTISEYINNNLSETEKKEFETLMQNNQELKEIVALHKELKAHYIRKNAINIATQIANAAKEQGLEPDVEAYEAWEAQQTKTKTKSKAFKAAAMIGIIAMALGFLFYKNYDEQKQKEEIAHILKIHYTDINLPFVNISANNTVLRDLYAGLQAFNGRDYEKAQTYFETYRRDNPDDATASLYLAVCYVKTQENEKAIPMLEAVMNNDKEEHLKSYAQWFLSQAYLSTAKIDKAKAILKNMKDDEKAIIILQQLE